MSVKFAFFRMFYWGFLVIVQHTVDLIFKHKKSDKEPCTVGTGSVSHDGNMLLIGQFCFRTFELHQLLFHVC